MKKMAPNGKFGIAHKQVKDYEYYVKKLEERGEISHAQSKKIVENYKNTYKNYKTMRSRVIY